MRSSAIRHGKCFDGTPPRRPRALCNRSARALHSRIGSLPVVRSRARESVPALSGTGAGARRARVAASAWSCLGVSPWMTAPWRCAAGCWTSAVSRHGCRARQRPRDFSDPSRIALSRGRRELGRADAREVRARFGVKTGDEIAQLPDALDDRGDDRGYPIRLSRGLLEAVSGKARRIPDIRRQGDLELLERLTSAHPSLGSPDGWRAEFGRELNATDDRLCFGASGLPVLEGKHIRPFAADVSGATLRIDREVAWRRIRSGSFTRDRLAYRDVSGVANRLSLIAAIIPAETATTHTLFCLRGQVSDRTAALPLRPVQQLRAQRCGSNVDGRAPDDHVD